MALSLLGVRGFLFPHFPGSDLCVRVHVLVCLCIVCLVKRTHGTARIWLRNVFWELIVSKF